MKSDSTSLATLALIAVAFLLPSSAVAQMKNDGAALTADTAAINPPSARSAFGRMAAGDMTAVDPKKLATVKQLLLMAKQMLQQQMQAQLQANLQKAAAATIVPGNGGGTQVPNPNTPIDNTPDPQACESACLQTELQCQANVLLDAAQTGIAVYSNWVAVNKAPIGDSGYEGLGGGFLKSGAAGSLGPDAPSVSLGVDPTGKSHWVGGGYDDTGPNIFVPPSINPRCMAGSASYAICGSSIEESVTEGGCGYVGPGVACVNKWGMEASLACPDIGGSSYQQWAAQLYTLFTAPMQACSSAWSACAGKC